MKIFFVTDNRPWFNKIDSWRSERIEEVKIFCSPKGKSLFEDEISQGFISPLDLKTDFKRLITEFDLGFSCHCKQIFPAELVENVNCFNFHPGLNPYNRGWFPQVFSIINELPVGATVHKMDKEIDHGAIVAQQEVQVLASDTSKSVYDRIMNEEFRLFDQHIESIISGSVTCNNPDNEGNYNSISDFRELCEIDLDKKVTFREAINYLRAMTFDGYDNAYFWDQANKNKVYVSLNIKSEPL